MAKPRPVSLILPSGASDEAPNRLIPKEKSPQPHGHSSSSSIDSNSMKNALLKRNSMPPAMLATLTNTINTTTTNTSTTTDSDVDSEQDERQQSDKPKNSLDTPDQRSRRLKHFQKLFKSDIPDEMPNLIDSYVCAYQGDILLQGKMYITDRYLCFHSRIISYVTKHVYRWEEIQGVSKERVAFIFPTAIGIQLKASGKKVFYASFITRDQAFDKILLVWSRAVGDIGSFDDDDQDPNNDGTLKATQTMVPRTGRGKRHPQDSADGPEHDEVLQMYLKDAHNGDKRRMHSASSKSSNDRDSRKTQKTDTKLTNGTTSVRHSRVNKNEPKTAESTKKDGPIESPPVQDPSPVSVTSPSNGSTTGASETGGLFVKILQIFVSLMNVIMEYLSASFAQLKSYPIKATAALFLFIILLVFHSFYLIQLAYRIEDRLQSLHHLWPSTFAKSRSEL